MISMIESRRAEIAGICRRFQVRRLEVFGSAARGTDFDPARSDFDFVVEFDPSVKAGLFDTYFPFKEALEALFGRNVDLVEEGAVENPYVRASIEQHREAVYGP